MKRRPSTYIHKPDLYVFDKHISGRRAVLPLVKSVLFRIHAPKATSVLLVGKFNQTGFKNHTMKRMVDGYWERSITLKRGHYEYRFLVDGEPTTDPRAHANLPDEQGRFNSIVEVG